MGKVEPVLTVVLLWMGGNSLLVPVRIFLGDGITSKDELDVWVVRAGT